MSILKSVIESARFVTSRAVHVSVDPDKAARWAVRLWDRGELPPWHGPAHFFDGTETTVQWIFVLTAINHCFWAPKGSRRWTLDSPGQTLDGYDALASALKRAHGQGHAILDADFLARVTPEALRETLGGRGELLLMKERARSLREAGRVLKERWSGSFAQVVRAAGGSAERLVSIVAEEFASFRDSADYRAREVFFFKRAQLLAADLFSAFKGQGYGEFRDIASLTCFPDYKLPQVLREMGVLVYSPALAGKVDSMVELAPGSKEEVEIRAATVVAVESMREHLTGEGRPVTAMELDYRLWHLGQKDEFRKRPYHRTRTIFY